MMLSSISSASGLMPGFFGAAAARPKGTRKSNIEARIVLNGNSFLAGGWLRCHEGESEKKTDQETKMK
jgi:hypothetical protein